MPESNDLQEVARQLQKLIEKLEVPRRKDWSDRLAVITSFVSTVVVALLGLYFTHSARTAEENRQREYQNAQIAIQRAQVRIEELKALTSVAPLLASRDSAQRQVARTILDAVNETRAPQPSSPAPSHGRPAHTPARDTGSGTGAAAQRVELSLLDTFIRRALNEQESEQRRVEALRQIGAVAASPGASQRVRDSALTAASTLVADPTTPETVRETAADVIARIKRVESRDIRPLIAGSPLRRTVSTIVLHHVGPPFRSSDFKGDTTILTLARWQTQRLGWNNRISWHYAIAPDGTIWLGMPLDVPAAHAAGFNQQSVSLLLFLDGDRELPTAQQRQSLALVIRELERKTGLSATDRAALVLHRDLARARSACPGRLIARDSVVAWLRAN